MRIIEYAKAHPYAAGTIAIIGGIIFIVIVRGSGDSGGSAGRVGPSDAEIAANAAIESARIGAQAATAQAGAAVSAAQIGAGVQLNSDNKAAEIAMLQITAASDIAKQTIAAEQSAFDSKLNIASQQQAGILAALPTLKKKNRDDVLQALATGQPYYPTASPSRTAQVLNGVGNAANGIGNAFSKIFSDERLKENIVHEGYDDRGRSIYAFNYRGSTTRRRGYIAQEIARSEPEQITFDKSGYMQIPANM